MKIAGFFCWLFKKKFYICTCNLVRFITTRKYYKNPIWKAKSHNRLTVSDFII